MHKPETIADFMARDGLPELINILVQRGRDAHANAEEGLDASAGARLGTYGYVSHDYRMAVLDDLKDERLAGLQRLNTNGRPGLVGDDLHIYLVGLRPNAGANGQTPLPNNPRNWPPSDRVQLELRDVSQPAEQSSITVLFLTFTRDQDGALEEVALRRPRIDNSGTVLGYVESQVAWKRGSGLNETQSEREIILAFPSQDTTNTPEFGAGKSEVEG
jgi:hypothetical protein